MRRDSASNSLLFCSLAAGSRNGRSFASSRAARNPRGDLAGGAARGQRARGDPRRSHRPSGGNAAHHLERAARRAAARLSRIERARPARAVRLLAPGQLRGADSGGPRAGAGARAAGKPGRSRGVASADCRALAGRARRSGLARARRGVDGQRHPLSAGLGLGAADRRSPRSPAERGADAVLAARAMGRERRAASPSNHRRRPRGGADQARSS